MLETRSFRGMPEFTWNNGARSSPHPMATPVRYGRLLYICLLIYISVLGLLYSCYFMANSDINLLMIEPS